MLFSSQPEVSRRSQTTGNAARRQDTGRRGPSARRLRGGGGGLFAPVFAVASAGERTGAGSARESPPASTTTDTHPLTRRLDPFLPIYLKRSLLPRIRHPIWPHHPHHHQSSPQASRRHHLKNTPLYTTPASLETRSSKISPGAIRSHPDTDGYPDFAQPFYPQPS